MPWHCSRTPIMRAQIGASRLMTSATRPQMNVIYALPVGRGKRLLGGMNGVANGVVSGWTVNSIVNRAGRVSRLHHNSATTRQTTAIHAIQFDHFSIPRFRAQWLPGMRTSGSIRTPSLRRRAIADSMAIWGGTPTRARSCDVGFFGLQGYARKRKNEPAVPSRDFQSLKPRQFQHSQPYHLCVASARRTLPFPSNRPRRDSYQAHPRRQGRFSLGLKLLW